MRKNMMLAAICMILALALAGCGSGTSAPAGAPRTTAEKPAGEPFAVLSQEADRFLKQNKPLFITAREVFDKFLVAGNQNMLLIDIRNDDHYARAHIPGALHIAYADAWRAEKLRHLPKDKKIVLVCYSGHTASQVAAYWSMLGYDAVPLYKGMSGWSRDRDVIGSTPLACDPFDYPVTADAAAPGTFSLPALEEKAAPAAALILRRAEAANSVPVVVQPAEVHARLGKPDLFVVDVRRPEHYRAGHIAGAVNIPFSSLAEPASMAMIPADRLVVLVDYDGHAASQGARILNMLGFKATAMKDGMSIWTKNEAVIGGPAVACNVTENPTTKLNANLKPGPSSAAT